MKVFNKLKKVAEKKLISDSKINQFVERDFDFDKYYFTTINIDQIDNYIDFEFSNEVGYSCLLGLKLSKFYKLKFLLDYWNTRIKSLMNNKKEFEFKESEKLQWTGDKDEFIELFYALKNTNTVNHGKVSYSEMINKFSLIFDIEPTSINPYKIMDNIKNRKKTSTKLIDKMKHVMMKFINV